MLLGGVWPLSVLERFVPGFFFHGFSYSGIAGDDE